MNQDNIDLLSTENLSQSNIYNFKNLIENNMDNGQRNPDNDSPYFDIEIDSNYYDIDEFMRLKNAHSNISLLSLNINSLASKFTKFKDFHNELCSNKSNFDFMCLQEVFIWIIIIQFNQKQGQYIKEAALLYIFLTHINTKF